MRESEQALKLYRIQVAYNKRPISGQAPTRLYVLVENEEQLDEALRRYANVTERLEPELVAARARKMPPALGFFIDMRERQKTEQ